MPVVTVFLKNRTEKLSCERGSLLKDVLVAGGIYVDAPCGGTGKCGKCTVGAVGELTGPTHSERGLPPGVRLSCMTRVLGDCEVRLSGDAGSMEVALSGRSAGGGCSLAGGEGLGAAVDIGTTTVVCRLFDVSSGAELGACGEVNLQRSFGADVISRVGACVENGDAARAMTESIRTQLSGMLERLCEDAGRSRDELLSVSVAGNTVMCHLFAGLDPSGMAALPFEPESLFGEGFECPGECLGLSSDAGIYILPAASAFVGGDITGAIISCGMDESGRTELLTDIGTNGEIALSHGGRLFCCATAAGPAFEGADISCGMSGSKGAVSRVWLNENGEPDFEVIGGGAPEGICGSGLVDALGVMLELGAVDFSGRMIFPDEAEDGALARRLGEDEDGNAFFTLCENVRITSGDVRKLQLAKAAVAAGIRTLLDLASVGCDGVERLFIAGGFGNSISVRNAAAIGLIPPELEKKAVSVGNAAAEGACMTLCSPDARRRAETVGRELCYRDLSSDPVFTEHYVEEMLFGGE